MRSLGRNEHKTRHRRAPSLCALQRLEANVRVPPTLARCHQLFFLTCSLPLAGTNGSRRHAFLNSTSPTSPFRRTLPRRKRRPLRLARLPRKLPLRLVGHRWGEGDVRKAGAVRNGGGMTTMGREGRRCDSPCQTRSKSSSWTTGRPSRRTIRCVSTFCGTG